MKNLTDHFDQLRRVSFFSSQSINRINHMKSPADGATVPGYPGTTHPSLPASGSSKASLFSAAAHTLGFYRTFEGRFNLSAFPNLGVYNLLGGEQRQAQVGPCVSTVPDYLNSTDKLTLGQFVCTANGRRSISNTLRQTKFVSTSIFEVVQVRVAPPRM